ncbi:MAG: hypothetical protein D6797_05080 [Bdellovibrio sp.]|nr:MAG: hypothetical protein D6797_05080 [Bdellovibrio sp.]
MKKKKYFLGAFLVILLMSPFTTWAKKILKKKKKVKKVYLNFEDELVEGSVKKPDVMTLFHRKQFNFKKLIKLRDNFLPEMDRTAEDVKRARGKD